MAFTRRRSYQQCFCNLCQGHQYVHRETRRRHSIRYGSLAPEEITERMNSKGRATSVIPPASYSTQRRIAAQHRAAIDLALLFPEEEEHEDGTPPPAPLEEEEHEDGTPPPAPLEEGEHEDGTPPPAPVEEEEEESDMEQEESDDEAHATFKPFIQQWLRGKMSTQIFTNAYIV